VLALWVAVGAAILLVAGALWVTARRAHDDVTPTVTAFAEFRAALGPAVAEVERERGALAATLARRRREPAR